MTHTRIVFKNKKTAFIHRADSCDLYEVVESDGVKQVHLLGYYYREDINQSGDTSAWGLYKPNSVYVSIIDILKVGYENRSNDGSVRAALAGIRVMMFTRCEAAGYHVQEGLTPAQVAEGLAEYTPLRYCDLSLDTPCGLYIDLF